MTAIVSAARAVANRALDAALPANCVGCGAEGPSICARCEPALDARLGDPAGVPIGLPGDLPEPLLQLEWCAPFHGVTRDALHAIKYGGEQRLAEPLGQAIARRWAAVGVGADLVGERPGPRGPCSAARLRPGRADRAPRRPRAATALLARSCSARARRSPSSTWTGGTARTTSRAHSSLDPRSPPTPSAVDGSCSSTTSSRPARRWPPARTRCMAAASLGVSAITVARER